MNRMESVRRIDELGRIVIPKGIRSHLRINEGDRLTIGVNQEGKIEIQKYNSFIPNYDLLTNIVTSLAKEIRTSVIMVHDGIIFTTGNIENESLKVGQEIRGRLYEKLFARKNYIGINEEIVSNSEKYHFTMFPIAYNSEILGGLIVMYNNSLSEDMIKIINAFRNLLTMVLKV